MIVLMRVLEKEFGRGVRVGLVGLVVCQRIFNRSKMNSYSGLVRTSGDCQVVVVISIQQENMGDVKVYRLGYYGK